MDGHLRCCEAPSRGMMEAQARALGLLAALVVTILCFFAAAAPNALGAADPGGAAGGTIAPSGGYTNPFTEYVDPYSTYENPFASTYTPSSGPVGQSSSNPAWNWLSPSQSGESIKHMSFVDEREGWAVGTFKGVRHTTDGGLTWSAARFGPPLGSNDICFVDSQHGWIVGQGNNSWDWMTNCGYIWATDDGGATWQQQLYQEGARTGLTAVWFSDTQNGWATGLGGLLLHTTDGGATWNQVENLPPESETDLFAMAWPTPDAGFILTDAIDTGDGPHQYLLSTIDGGATWLANAITSDRPSTSIWHLAFADQDHGYVCGWGGAVLATGDGGETWENRSLPALGKEGDDVQALLLNGADEVWAAVNDSVVAHTTDGGLTWDIADMGTPVALQTIARLDESTILSMGDIGYGVISRDDGRSWEPTADGIWTHDSNSICFTSTWRGWICGAEGALWRTVDGGLTWTSQDTGRSEDLLKVRFADSSHGFIVGGSGLILRTVDAGESWQTIDSGVSTDLLDVTFLDASRGWIVGTEGTVLHTRDGGTTWVVQQSGLTTDFVTVFFLDGQTGWAAGSEPRPEENASVGWVYSTTDGGLTWSPHHFTDLPNGNVRQIKFLDAMNGVAVGWSSEGVGGPEGMFRSSDGGATWTYTVMYPWPPQVLSTLTFSTSTTGLMLGGHGLAYATTDGGATWVMHMRACVDDGIVDVMFLDDEVGFALTSMGAVLRTDVGGFVDYHVRWTLDSAKSPDDIVLNITNKDQWFHDYYVMGYDADGRMIERGISIASATDLWMAGGDSVSATLTELFPLCADQIRSLAVCTGEDLDLSTIADISLTYQ
jgi:photosystem II stability/assembly factor-like uncharacterized protein